MRFMFWYRVGRNGISSRSWGRGKLQKLRTTQYYRRSSLDSIRQLTRAATITATATATIVIIIVIIIIIARISAYALNITDDVTTFSLKSRRTRSSTNQDVSLSLIL